MRWFIAIFGLVGLGMLVATGLTFKNTMDFRAQSVAVEGQVIDFARSRSSKGGSMYAPRVRYTIPAAEGGLGQSFEVVGSISSSSRGYDIGEKIMVRYRPEAPADGRIQSFLEQWFLVTLFGFFALVFGGVAAGFIIAGIRQRRLYEWLQHSGMSVQAQIIEVGKNTNLKINGRSPWVVRAQWQHPVTQEVHVFQSENLWYDPSQFIGDREQIPVRVDADNPKRFRVDISWLPKSA
jgi:hypothetical protein